MAKGEGIGRFIPDKLKPEIKALSFDGFISALQANGVTLVEATPKTTTLFKVGTSRDNIAGGRYRYDIDFSGGGKGRKVGYHHECAEKSSMSEEGFVDPRGGGSLAFREPAARLEELYTLTTFVTADTMLSQITEAIPGCQTQIRDADRVFTEEDYEELHRVAKQQQIRPW